MPLFADVAVLAPLGRSLTYEVPSGMRLLPGQRVVCPLRGRQCLGVVLSLGPRPASAPKRLQAIGALVDDTPALPEELLRFMRELADYYLAPIGEVMRAALPAVPRDKLANLRVPGELFALERVDGAKELAVRKVLYACATDGVEAAGTLRGQAAGALALLRSHGELPVSRLEERFGNARSALKKLEGLGLVTLALRDREADPYFTEAMPRDVPPTLTEPQERAAARILLALEGKLELKGFLLFGVTGSGKTEVYLRAIEATLARGRGALVLVPEIALTPQLVARYRARFGDDVAVVHSGLSARDRHVMWTKLREARVRVAIGARSALFSPVPNLGLVLVDEEHEASFKQEEGVRYHARDMAILRAHRAGAVIVLGSATPSLEAVELARRGRLEELHLPGRAHAGALLPEVTLVDLRRMRAGPTGERLISLPLHRAVEATLAAGQQVILFLNRRGFAPSVVCEACGVVVTCPSCSVALTYHRAGGGSLRCHYCDYGTPHVNMCEACKAPALALEGLGTEKLEDAIAKAFPNARVGRLDRDVAAGARSEVVLDRMRSGELDILVGTQMVTKGHDLPRVTLVGVLNADAALSLPDFRAAERAFSLLVQVAGRAGRHDLRGRVLIQTRTPEHPAVALAARHDVLGFLDKELAERKEARYPPYFRLVLVRFDAVEEEVARAAAQDLAMRARVTQPVLDRRVEVLGPSAAPVARLRGRFRFRVMLRSADRKALRAVAIELVRAAERIERRVRVVVDVDPVAML
jgi:primosomal protein N' (replication factor Y)